jgi:peptidoglycan DL-endopeptidase CwlO
VPAASILLTVLLGGCVRYPGPLTYLGRTPPTAEGRPRTEIPVTPAASPLQARVIESAEFYLGTAPPRDDCSGFVSAVLTKAGLPTDGSTRSLYDAAADARLLHKRRVPQVGDLVFFDDTYDRNDNRRLDDRLSHMGVVVAVDRDGTATIAHGGTSKGRTTMVMNLLYPTIEVDASGKRLNDPLRARGDRDPPATKYLASQLWRAFAVLSLR